MKSPSQPFRLAHGGLIDRDRELSFTFDGKRFAGYAGDTLAAALLANGVRLVGRSFKYHRRRGILTAGSEEPNALVELRTGARREPNSRATTVELYDGLSATSQNRWPSLEFDMMSINNLLAPVFVAGFYYKTFMWPSAFWEKVYEPMIRRAAGLGRAAEEADPDSYEKATAFADVLVIGGGPAGLMAALTAARTGARVILADESFEFGGRLLADKRTIDGTSGTNWRDGVVAELSAMPEVRLMSRTTVFGAYDSGTFGAIERVSDHVIEPAPHKPRQRLWRIVAKRTVVAAGGTERPIVFGNNDLPGVMLAGAVRTYINRFGVIPGRKAVVFTNNDDGASTVADLIKAGADVVALVDTRESISKPIRMLAEQNQIRVITGGAIADAEGRHRVKRARIITSKGDDSYFDCDLIAVSGGWNPNVQITTHLNGRPSWDDFLQAFVPGALPKGMDVAGVAGGDFSLAACLSSGARSGAEAAVEAGFPEPTVQVPQAGGEATSISAFWHVEAAHHKAFVDLQNDVATSDIVLAEREGFRAVEHLKRYTTLGMATDQGKTSNVNGLAILAKLTGKSIPQTGITTARPPYSPVALGAFAGHHRGQSFKPMRESPSFAWAKEQGARFVEAGLWLRPSCFPRPEDRDLTETISREVRTVRSAVGICDVSSLGKIDVQGTDAADFLDRIYINNMKSLKVGRARYGCMLREDGILMDDGTVARFSDSHFFLTTTTANAAKVYQHMQFCAQWLWPELDVQISSATEQWAQYAIAGPKSRMLLQRIVDPSFDISDEAFPYMHVGAVTVCGGIKARLYRLSFSGERAYELGVPARYGDSLIRQLMEAGRDLGVCAYGTEALGVMRIEKGHISGPEINGTTTPTDVGLGGMVSKKKKDFIGRVLGNRPGLVDADRPMLVGLKPVEHSARLRAGAHFLACDAEAKPENDQGHMTSVAYSPERGHWVGLGLLKRGPERLGEIVRAYDPLRGGSLLLEVVSPVFVDPEGEKLRG